MEKSLWQKLQNYKSDISFYSTIFLVISTIPVILNWSLFWLNSIFGTHFIFHPIISGFFWQLIWSGFFSTNSLILSRISGFWFASFFHFVQNPFSHFFYPFFQSFKTKFCQLLPIFRIH